ncbi:MAG TPA: PRC-barrel domain-containing protein [Flavisolibacter sp.]|nr:PRC-barrel domain-containing protein [Flavisolibacter sp.]
MFGKKKDTPTTRLRELSHSDFKIAKGQPDIRGWDVRDEQGRKFGTVGELIFDIRADKVRYMVIDILDTPELELEKRSVMVPIGMAELDPTDNDVLLPNVTPYQLRALPRYQTAKLGAKTERDIRTVFGDTNLGMNKSQQPTASTEEDVDESFYNNEQFNEDNMYRRRRARIIDHDNDREYNDSTYTRREVDMSVPVSDRRQVYDDDIRPNETDEEYFRRTGRRPRY